ncbi:MAG: putative glycoside hydrolase, partial [Actinomycetota bacterium]|nr:putative glycoside hydrolase [Actinomycetota bacterium]
MRAHYDRMKTYSGYFDSRTSWFPGAWAYKDLYAIYKDDTALLEEHPEWVLKDSRRARLYIPFDCGGGSCPQYAADVGNPAFRRAWIAEARAVIAQGYKGLFIDDVNMEFRVADGSGEEVAPIDPRTGQPMTHANWRRYIADFVEEVRAALPGVEIAHNPIWFSGHEDPATARALLAADYIDLERGVNDGGITAGGGKYGYETLLAHVDWLHARGKAVVFDSYTDDQPGAEYNLASYFLVNGTRDGFRTNFRTKPDDWWKGYDVDLGAASGTRYAWNGLLRRDFQKGYVLVNQPGRPTKTIATAPATGPDGTPRPTINLAGGSGAVMVARSRPVRLSLSAGGRGRVLTARGRVGGRTSGTVALSAYHAPKRGRFRRVARRKATLRNGRFKTRIARFRRGRWRVQAALQGAPSAVDAKKFRLEDQGKQGPQQALPTDDGRRALGGEDQAGTNDPQATASAVTEARYSDPVSTGPLPGGGYLGRNFQATGNAIRSLQRTLTTAGFQSAPNGTFDT